MTNRKMIVFLFDGLLRYVRGYLLEVAGKKSDIIMSSILYAQVLNLKMDQWPARIGAFASQLREFECIRNFFTASTLATLVDLPFAIIFLLVIYYIGGPMIAVPLVIIALLLLYSFILVKPLKASVEARPIPCAPPVTMATFSFNDCITRLLSSWNLGQIRFSNTGPGAVCSNSVCLLLGRV